MSAVRKWGGDGLFEAVGGWDNDLARDPPPRVSRSGRVLCAPSFAIYIISSLIVTNPVSVEREKVVMACDVQTTCAAQVVT